MSLSTTFFTPTPRCTIRKPFWRKQSQSWVVKLPGGRLRTLGKDEHGEGRQHPPPRIVEAWHALASKETGTKPGQEHRPKDMKLSELRDGYLESLPHPKTRINTRDQLDWFIAYMGDIKVSQVEVHRALAYLASKKTWGSTSKATALERITAAINWAIGVQRLDRAYRLEVPKSMKPRRKKRKTVLTADVQATLEAKAHPALRDILAGLRLSGARPGELCGATVADFDEKGGVLKVLNKTRNKTGVEYRPLYLSPQMIALVKGLIGERKDGHVFRRQNGKPWTAPYLSHLFWRLRVRLGLPEGVVAYAERHTFASNAINKGDVNPALVARLMGHTDLVMLMRTYYSEDPAAMRKAIEEATKEG